jgi:hypothetical protein
MFTIAENVLEYMLKSISMVLSWNGVWRRAS